MTRSAILEELDISIANKIKDKEYINKLKKTKDKVKYLRVVKNYTQLESSEIIGISLRQVQRVEADFKKNEKN